MELSGIPQTATRRFTRNVNSWLGEVSNLANFIWDIETGPAPDMPPFDRDQALEALREKYKKEATIQEHLAKAERDWIEKAALSPFRGRVLAIGVMACNQDGDEPSPLILCDDDERALLESFWLAIASTRGTWAGFNTDRFDFPFVCKRSWIRNVFIPPYAFYTRSGRWYSGERFLDLQSVWGCGEQFPEGSVDVISKALGIGQKNGDGAFFHVLWDGGDVGQAAAEEYLMNDLTLERSIAERLVPHLY
jgi:DNA polymerase elongation subunit (family B)